MLSAGVRESRANMILWLQDKAKTVKQFSLSRALLAWVVTVLSHVLITCTGLVWAMVRAVLVSLYVLVDGVVIATWFWWSVYRKGKS